MIQTSVPTFTATATPGELARSRRVRLVLIVLGLALLASVAAYLLVDLKGAWQYALDLRSRQVGALVVVGASVGVASLVLYVMDAPSVDPGVLAGFLSWFIAQACATTINFVVMRTVIFRD